MQFVAWGFLVLQALIVIASLMGYGIFTARPDLLIKIDPQARFFTWAFHGFAVGNMLFGGLMIESLLKEIVHDPALLTPAVIERSNRNR